MTLQNQFLKILLLLGLPFALSSIICEDFSDRDYRYDSVPKSNNRKPFYASTNEAYTIRSSSNTTALKPIDTLANGNRMYIVDREQGFFIYDTSSTLLGAVQCYGIDTVKVQDSIFYANNYMDWVAINVADAQNPLEISRQKNAFPRLFPRDYPTDFWGYFECYDPKKGIAVRWDSTTLANPFCRK